MPSADGLLVVDYARDGKPIGVEITAPTAVPLDRLNSLLADLGQTPLNEHDYLPVNVLRESNSSEPLVERRRPHLVPHASRYPIGRLEPRVTEAKLRFS